MKCFQKKSFQIRQKFDAENGLKNSIWVEGARLSSYGCVKKLSHLGPQTCSQFYFLLTSHPTQR